MNKKGFTLIEVIVSVVLVSIVMVSLTATLVEIKKKSGTVASNTDAVIYSGIMARVLNSDVASHNGIKFIECEPNGSKCGLVLGDNEKRTIQIIDDDRTIASCKVKKNNSTGIFYLVNNSGNEDGSCRGVIDIEQVKKSNDYNPAFNTNKCIVKSNCLGAKYIATNGDAKCECFKEKITSSIVYKDITSGTDTVITNEDSNKVVYAKTLSYVRTIEENATDTNVKNVTTDGYGFSRLYYRQDSFKNKEASSTSVLSNLTIGIYDGIDKNDATHNVVLYSGSTIKSGVDASVGDKYDITLNTQGNLKEPNLISQPKICSNPSDSDTCDPVNKIVEIYNIGFNSTHVSATSSGDASLNTIDKLDVVPCIVRIIDATAQPLRYDCDNSKIKFKGYYTKTYDRNTESNKIINNVGTPTGTVSTCPGVQVIDASGKIVAPPNYFSSNTTVYACWNYIP